MKKLTLYITLMMGLAVAGWGQSLTLSVFQNSTDNLFQTRYGEKDRISNLAFSLDHSFAPFSLFTEGSYSHLYENTSASFFTQDIGIDYLYAASSKTAIYLSAKLGGTIYRTDYADFNDIAFGAMAAVKSYLTPASIMKLSYTFDYRNYRYAPFDFISHLANFSVDRYFETRTTFRADLSWGYKYFRHPFVPEQSPVQVPPVDQDHSGDTKGHWSGHGGWSGFGTPVSGNASQGQGIQIASVSGVIAQGLGDKIGLRLSGVRQWTLSGQNPYKSIAEFYMVENPTYDIFSWNGYGLSSQLTLEAPLNTQLKMGYTRFQKEFPGIEAIDLEGTSLDVLRADTRIQWEARVEKNFSTLSVFFSYSYINNRSNDPLFDWKGHFLSAGCAWNFNWGGKR